MDIPDVCTAQEAADYLRLSVGQLDALARTGRIGYIKTGRVRTFPAEALRAFVSANTITAVANPHGLTDRSLARVRRIAS